jgi:nucleotide-binding universal stress UspA family protein
MKSVLLYANEDKGFESRLQTALDIVRAFSGHLTCLHATPFNAFVMSDPFGGAYALTGVMDQLREAEEAHRSKLENRLRIEGVAWEWLSYDGTPAQLLTARSGLADLIVTSLPAGDDDESLSITADIAIHARTPVLAVPRTARSFDCAATAMVAWNGSLEAAHALRLTLPMIRRAGAVRIVAVTEAASDFPADEASRYLSLHGIATELSERSIGGGSTAEALIEAAESLGAAYVVMGAYGHTRIAEAVLGGVTREMLRSSPIPLLLAH